MHVVNAREGARSALRAGATDLLSPPYAACHAGVGYYAALVESLQHEFPDTPFHLTLCCGDDPATAHAALRSGFRSIICNTTPGMLEKLRAIAAGLNAEVLAEYPEPLLRGGR